MVKRKGVKACIYCNGKKIKCVRESDTVSCQKCISLNLVCCNRRSKEVLVVSAEILKQREEEIGELKRKIRLLEEEKSSKDEFSHNTMHINNFNINQDSSHAISACVKCTSSSVRFCNYVHGYLNGSVVKSRNMEIQLGDYVNLKKLDIELPSKNKALSLLQTAYNYLSNDYYLLILSDTLLIMENLYDSVDLNGVDKVELSRIFFLFSLGEIYSKPEKKENNDIIDGKYLKIAFQLTQYSLSEPSISKIEVLLLAAIYFNSSSLLNYAYIYIGACSRMAILLGLNNIIEGSQAKERGNRLWYSIYTLEVSLCSALGLKVSMPEILIDKFKLSLIYNSELGESYFIGKRVILAQLNRKIIEKVYFLNQTNESLFVTINIIIKELNNFYVELMNDLRSIGISIRDKIKRSSMSLKLRFNELLILVTRPILYSVFVINESHCGKPEEDRKVSLHALKLSETCIYASMSNINIINDMFSCVNSTKYSYYDVNFLFSSCIIMILAESLNYFSKMEFQNSSKDITSFTDISISMMQKLAMSGNPTAKSLLSLVSQLKVRLETNRKKRNPITTQPTIRDSYIIQKIIEGNDSLLDFNFDSNFDFNFDFESFGIELP